MGMQFRGIINWSRAQGSSGTFDYGNVGSGNINRERDFGTSRREPRDI